MINYREVFFLLIFKKYFLEKSQNISAHITQDTSPKYINNSNNKSSSPNKSPPVSYKKRKETISPDNKKSSPSLNNASLSPIRKSNCGG